MTLEPGAAVTTTYAERAMGMAGHLDTDDFKVAIASDLLADIPRSLSRNDSFRAACSSSWTKARR
ncbi:MAG: hypothetical protein MZV65_39890 [Chromatiales bacterium]|nr:hypothetical protein [Chromatiales bacterium]